MAQSWSCWVETCFGGHPSGWVGHHQGWKSQKSHGSKLVLLGRDLFRWTPIWLGGHHQEWKSQKSHGSKLVLLGRDLFRWKPNYLGRTQNEVKVIGPTLNHDFCDFSTLGGVRPDRWVSTETGLDPAGPT